jgi:hypothetical protein
MPKLSDHHTQKLVKALYIGDSGTGKTGSLVSLVKAGYKLRVIDMDNGLDILYQYVRHECPDKLNNVEYETVRDQYEFAKTAGQVNSNAIPLSAARVKGIPTAFIKAHELMNKWSDGTVPATWGSEYILVLDSLTAFGVAGLAWASALNPTAKEPRTWFFTAQQAVEKTMALLTSEEFNANVLVISHVRYQEQPDGAMKGYANAIGAAIGPIIPKYFNNLVLAQTTGSGKAVRRNILTVPTAMIDLKNSAPFVVDQQLPLETGLATLFKQLTTQEKAS